MAPDARRSTLHFTFLTPGGAKAKMRSVSFRQEGALGYRRARRTIAAVSL
jgi:hypothetical protein